MEAAPEKIRVKKLYLLVHPGFIAGPDVDFATDRGPSQEDIKLSRALLEKYLIKARSLQNDEMMVVFGYADPDEFVRHQETKAMYAQRIKELQEILGDRLILIEGNIDPFEDEHAFEEVEFIADERGFFIDRDTSTEAFGETAECCVLDCAQNFNTAGKFDSKTLINLNLTDLSDEEPESPYIQKLVRENRIKISRVNISMNGIIIE